MTTLQKIIKYGAIAFGTYLSFMIISGIILVFTTIFGITIGIEQWQSNTTQEIEIQNITQEYENVENLEIDIALCRLTIQKGDKLKVEASHVSEKMECKMENNTLQIKDKKMNTTWFQNLDTVPEVVIYIPENTKLETVEIKTGVNNTKIENLECEKIEIEAGVGQCEIRSIIAKDANIKGGAGKTIIEEMTVDELHLEAGIGDMIFTGEILQKADVDSGVGKLEFNIEGNKDEYQLKAQTGLGNFLVDNQKVKDNQTIGNGEKTVKIKAGVGATIVNFKDKTI